MGNILSLVTPMFPFAIVLCFICLVVLSLICFLLGRGATLNRIPINTVIYYSKKVPVEEW